MVDCVIHPIRLALLSSKIQISPDKLNILQKMIHGNSFEQRTEKNPTDQSAVRCNGVVSYRPLAKHSSLTDRRNNALGTIAISTTRTRPTSCLTVAAVVAFWLWSCSLVISRTLATISVVSHVATRTGIQTPQHCCSLRVTLSISTASWSTCTLKKSENPAMAAGGMDRKIVEVRTHA